MITIGKKWHDLAVKCLSRLLQRITSNHDGDQYSMTNIPPVDFLSKNL